MRRPRQGGDQRVAEELHSLSHSSIMVILTSIVASDNMYDSVLIADDGDGKKMENGSFRAPAPRPSGAIELLVARCLVAFLDNTIYYRPWSLSTQRQERLNATPSLPL